MASKSYECSKCSKTGYLEGMEEHFIRTHVSAERAPWRCSLCGFKAVSRQHIKQHENHYKHRKAKKKWPREDVEYIQSESPYKVKIGVDIFEYEQEKPRYFPELIDYHHGWPSQRPGRESSTDCDNGRKRTRQSGIDGSSKKSKTSENSSRSANLNTTRKSSRRTTRPEDYGRRGGRDFEKNETIYRQDPTSTTDVSKSEKSAEPEASTSTAKTTPSTSFEANQVNSLIPSVQTDTTENIKVEIKEEKIDDGNMDTSGDLIVVDDEEEEEEEEKTLARLEGKISELVSALVPLQNISKALIALDHHMRKLVPAVGKLTAKGSSKNC